MTAARSRGHIRPSNPVAARYAAPSSDRPFILLVKDVQAEGAVGQPVAHCLESDQREPPIDTQLSDLLSWTHCGQPHRTCPSRISRRFRGVEAAGLSSAAARHHGVLVLARARDLGAGPGVLADKQPTRLPQYLERGSGRSDTRPGPGRFRSRMPAAASAASAAPGCSRRWLTGLTPAHTAVLIAAPPHPVGISEFGERGDISIGTGCYRLGVQMRELDEKHVLARADNAQLPAEVIVVRDIGHAPCLGIVHRDTSGVAATDTTSIGPDVHVRDRALTAVMNIDPQHLAGPAEPLDLDLCQVGDFLPGELARLMLVRLAQLRIQPDGPGSQGYGAEREDHRSVSGDLRGRAEQATQTKAAGYQAHRGDGGQDVP